MALRATLRAAFRLARVWWFFRRPRHTGACVALWWNGRLLLVKTSYRRMWSLPGGGVQTGEDPAAAALRELEEETALKLDPQDLRFHATMRTRHDFRHETVHLFEATAQERPDPTPDGRETVAAALVPRGDISEAAICPVLRHYLSLREHPPDPAHRPTL